MMKILKGLLTFWLFHLFLYRYFVIPEGICLDIRPSKESRRLKSDILAAKNYNFCFSTLPSSQNFLFVKPLSIYTGTSNHRNIKLRHTPNSVDPEKNTNEREEKKLIVANSSELHRLASYNDLKQSLVSISNRFVDIVGSAKDYLRKSKIYEIVYTFINGIKARANNLTVKKQIVILLLSQLLYSFILPNFHIILPYQLIPTDSGLGVDIGLDTIVSMVFSYLFLNDLNISSKPLIVPEDIKKRIPWVVLSLIGSYVLSGYFTHVIDNAILLISAMDAPVSVAMHQSLRVLIGHIFWVLVGSMIINKTVFPLSFNANNPWYKFRINDNWVFPCLSGYFLSCTLYNLADLFYSFLVKIYSTFTSNADRFDNSDENLVSQLTESNEVLPTILGAIGPCITAPWWEETLYRVLILKSLNIYLPHLLSSIISSFLFAVHHLNPRSVIHLFVLGVIWSLIEKNFDNLIVTIIIHSLWNSRIFIGSMIGL
ncbi:conserved hypothetical protein [Theileria equi strain WA]|uniref:CAAX prenyl protease 2/Lysostaphin resistance protein A-like domain-containing protein n=1 Tax=Theileria equi strain WA TaxID=1537102 RepID=L1LD10_THEEQ|nr:conserved hypothetical protein [Theileria equi strain WA]EKX73169.1 conserved hypothetical protein [Theileria equi strain WA]|eukprot:XP_004832621.1 conserved hypothetical protein [Theileria equi strain WA]